MMRCMQLGVPIEGGGGCVDDAAILVITVSEGEDDFSSVAVAEGEADFSSVAVAEGESEFPSVAKKEGDAEFSSFAGP